MVSILIYVTFYSQKAMMQYMYNVYIPIDIGAYLWNITTLVSYNTEFFLNRYQLHEKRWLS